MKKLYISLFTILMTTISFGQTSDLYFSMYGEGSSNNKFLEIYNGTGADVNLDNYAFPNVSNDPTVTGEYEFWNTFPTGFIVADGDVFVIAHSLADAAILAEADMTFDFLSNGDDGFALVANDGIWNDADTDGNVDAGEMTGFTILDWIGDWNGDPGTGWDVAGVPAATANHTLTRKSSVCGPNNSWANSAGTDASDSEWIVGASDSGWGDLGSYVGCSTIPVISITSPANNNVFPAGTGSVDVTFSTDSAPLSSQVDIIVNGVRTTDVTSPFSVTIANGQSYIITVELIDGSVIASDTINFSVEWPCDLVLGAETAQCDTETNGADTYTATLEFTGGATSTYTIDTGGIGTVSGNSPSASGSGIITISNIPEGVNLPITIMGDVGDSSCNLSTTIASPLCIGSLTCPAEGSIVITEIMQNPSAVGDNEGEWFEVYNTTGSPIDMQGWIIKDEASLTEEHIITASVIVPANGYAVLGINSDTATNGGVSVDYQYSTISLGNSTDGLILECSSTTIDAVTWDNGATFPDPNGSSMSLKVTNLNSTDNDTGLNWETVAFTYGDGDNGTPGGPNDVQLSANSNQIEGFKFSPNPTSLGYVNISSRNQAAMKVNVYDILGKQVINTSVTNKRLDLSGLNKGVYIMKVSQDDATTTKKLVIK